MKKVSGTLKLLYSQYRELQSFAQFGSDLDADTRSRLRQGERIVEVLKQNKNAPVSVEDQVCILFAVTRNYLADIKVEEVAEYEKGLFERMKAQHSAILEEIRATGALSNENDKALAEAIEAYTKDFLKQRQ